MPLTAASIKLNTTTCVVTSGRPKRVVRIALDDDPRVKPLVRWAGGKQWLARLGRNLLPPCFKGKYFEPFCGGAALFYALDLAPALLSDLNEELITCYAAVRDDARGVIKLLRGYPHISTYYYRLRSMKARTPRHVAARFLYLNRTCWNGLYRVNSKGGFNTPFGRRDNPDLIDRDCLLAAADRLKGVDLLNCDFATAVETAKAGDLVYFDPPYISGHQNNGFLMYNAHLFSWADQLRLAATAVALASNGIHVLVSNTNHAAVLRLYKGFHYYRVPRRSLIAGQVDSRGVVLEALLSSYPLFTCNSEVP